MHIHTWETPYTCDECEYTCTSVSQLNIYKFNSKGMSFNPEKNMQAISFLSSMKVLKTLKQLVKGNDWYVQYVTMHAKQINI